MTCQRLPHLIVTSTLAALALAGCSSTGTLRGMVLDADGQPLGNTSEQDTLVVALLCGGTETNVECLADDLLEQIAIEDLIASVCGPGDTREDCLVHLGRSAAALGADGSYELDRLPAGQYGLVFIYSSPDLRGDQPVPPGFHPILEQGFGIMRDVPPIEGDQATVYDIPTRLRRAD